MTFIVRWEPVLGFCLRVSFKSIEKTTSSVLSFILINLWNKPTNKDKIANTKYPQLMVENGFQNLDLILFYETTPMPPPLPCNLNQSFVKISCIKSHLCILLNSKWHELSIQKCQYHWSVEWASPFFFFILFVHRSWTTNFVPFFNN